MNSDFDVRYTAQLARLTLSEEEIEKFQSQLSQVLNTSRNCARLTPPEWSPLRTQTRYTTYSRGRIRDWLTAEQALANAPRQANGLFVVTKVIE